MNPEPLKHCPLCNSDLSIGEFGICRARNDGRNLYCKVCIRQKVTESRRALKEYKSAKKRRIEKQREQVEAPVLPDPITKLSPIDHVRLAISRGARTQREIHIETRLHKDAIGDAHTVLLLWNHEIKSGIVHGERVYFFPAEQSEIEVKRKQDVLSGFSGIQAIMPERKRA